MTTTTVSQEAREAAALTWLEKQIAHLTGLLAKADTETQHFEKLVEEGQECWASNVRLWRKYADDHRDKLSIYTTIRDTFVDRDEWRTQHENLLRIRQSELARHRQQAERAFEERERKLREALETLEASLTRDMGAGYAGVALCQALKETPDAQ